MPVRTMGIPLRTVEPRPVDLEPGLDLETRCFKCRVFRYSTSNRHRTDRGQQVDDGWICEGCIRLMDGIKAPTYAELENKLKELQASSAALRDAYNTLLSGIVANIERDARGA